MLLLLLFAFVVRELGRETDIPGLIAGEKLLR